MHRLIIMAALLSAFLPGVCAAETDTATQRRISDIEQQISRQKAQLHELKNEAGLGFLVLFLFGLVLSMWAMNRRRSGCVWFVLGVIPMINILAGLVALRAESEHWKANDRGV